MSGRQRIKICGVADPDTARVAVREGADYIGLVFYPGSHRYVEPEHAREVSRAARAAANGTSPQVVGLFVNVPVDEVLRVREIAGLDIIQLSGDEPVADMRRLRAEGVPFLATVRVGEDHEAARARFDEIAAEEPLAVHLDTQVPGMWGGSGVVGDWEFARELAAQYPVFLAGGLDPGNVGAAVEQVQPFVVDVSSGVETNKTKDHEKIRAFIAAARGREGEST